MPLSAPPPTWATVLGKPTTVSGFGISDAITSAVTSQIAGNGITVSAATGAVTVSQDFYTGSTKNNTSYPIGTYLASSYSVNPTTNLSVVPGIYTTDTYGQINSGASGTNYVVISGTWKNRGILVNDLGSNFGSLIQRIA